MSDKNPIFIVGRFNLVLIVILLIVISLLVRLFSLSILDQQFLKHQGDERVLRLIQSPAFRGIIQDRNGFPLAISSLVYSIWINPQEFSPQIDDLTKLAKLLQMNLKDINALVKKQKQTSHIFVYLKRGLAPDTANKIKLLNIFGVYTKEEYKRFYPEGEIAAHVVGFANVDDEGQEGIELGYNKWLSGAPGKKWVIKDRLGRLIDEVEDVGEQRSGNDLTLSIDRRIQFIAYQELLAGILKNKARSGSVIVLDAQSSEVLAMVNYPSYNPNNRPGQISAQLRNRAVTDTFEPGSTIKAFTVASGLASGKFGPDSLIDTSPGLLKVDKNWVRDGGKNNGVLTLSGILEVSSNVGAAKIVLALPSNQLWNLLHSVGFGEITGIGFPGEQSGRLVKHEHWGKFILATLAFGYGLSVTPLQLARAYAVIANNGIKQPVSLLRLDRPRTGERILEEKIAKQMLYLLERVTDRGSGRPARVPGYRVAGKSGTAKIVGKGGYEKHRYISSFVGIAPLTHPKLVVAVILNDPQGKDYYGGAVSGPIFEKILERSLHLLNIPSDQPEALNPAA